MVRLSCITVRVLCVGRYSRHTRPTGHADGCAAITVREVTWPRTAIRELISYSSLVGELNHYFDAEKCSIGWHGDAERKIAVGARFGYGANAFPLKFQWYMKGKPIGCEGNIKLHTGDVYIMSEKAVGYDTWAKPWIPTLRHAAGKATGTKNKGRRGGIGYQTLLKTKVVKGKPV